MFLSFVINKKVSLTNVNSWTKKKWHNDKKQTLEKLKSKNDFVKNLNIKYFLLSICLKEVGGVPGWLGW